MHHIACFSHRIHHGLQIIRILFHRLENLIFLGTQPLNLLHSFIFLHSVGISLPDEFFLAHISVGILLIQCNTKFYELCLFCTQLFFLPFQCGKKDQRFAFPFVPAYAPPALSALSARFGQSLPAFSQKSGFACRGCPPPWLKICS